jgi:hypothetical protein
MAAVTGSRELWTLFEPFHALTYFTPESAEAFEAIGLRGFWRGYFAGRAAPLGPVGAGAVTACFYGFHPAFVARALPSIWAIADPSDALAARLAGIDKAVHRICPDLMRDSRVAESARLLRGALERCHGEGRPLFSANRDLEWPAQPHLALWQATTATREHRGDGHVAVLTSKGIGPCEAHLLKLTAEGNSLQTIQPYRGWVDGDWAAGREQLRHRGWLDKDHAVTNEGRRAYEDVEGATDRLAAELLSYLSDDQIEVIAGQLDAVAHRLMGSATIPYPNPIGVPVPVSPGSVR